MSTEVFDAASTPEFVSFPDPNHPGRTITAAAQVLSGPKIVRSKRKVTGKGMPWQQSSWEYYDEIGEYSWAVELLATHVSKVQLVAAKESSGAEPIILTGDEYEEDGETVQPSKIEQDAADLVRGFAGGTSGQQQVMYRAAVHLIVAAETYIVGRQNLEGDPKWEAYSNEEVQSTNGTWLINDGTEKYELTDDDILIRVWRPHPKKRSEPRSSSKPLLPILAEIKGLTQAIGARIDSRLAGAGVLFVPESMSLMSSSSADIEEGEDPFVAELIDSMLTPIKDRDSAAAVVPIVVRVPDDSIGKIQHIRFEVTAKAEEAAQRLDAIGRLATTVDLPREQVTGMGDMNHWGSWQADEATVKGPVSTLAAIFVHALTVGYVRPGLLELGHAAEAIDELLAWFDVTDLIQRPDRSEQALQVYDRGGLGYAALLRETGFDAADEPTEEDICRKLLLDLVKADPANAAKWLQMLGPCAGITLPDMTDLFGDGTAMIEQQPGPAGAPVVEDQTDQNRELPAVTASSNVDCLYGTCEMAVLRALELAGKRMRGSSPRNVRAGLLEIPQHELHCNGLVASASTHTIDSLLEDAWSPLAIVLPGRDALVKDLDDYARLLIERRQPHEESWLRPIVEKHA